MIKLVNLVIFSSSFYTTRDIYISLAFIDIIKLDYVI
jgi:hypothetical protein